MKLISNIKKQFKRFMTGKSGFSLVELIVVIAIMAVMAAVLAPALLGYVERSRAQKDDSAMGEVTNAIQLSLADMDVYDEALQFAVKDNYSCYCDGDTSTNTDANKITTKSPDLWLFNDQARLLDETVYKPAGKMRGVTITLKPNGSAEYILKDGIVNKIGDDTTKKGTNAGKTLADCPELYNRIRSTVGDTITVSSQTYRNSDYTIFISMGTTGGNQADKQDAIKVYGQYNGTNLPTVATPVAGGSQSGGNAGGSEQPGSESEQPSEPAVTAGATFYTLKTNDCHQYLDQHTDACFNSTFLTWDELKLEENGTKYGYDASAITDTSIGDYAFCDNLSIANITIPDSVTSIGYEAFMGTYLITDITIPDSVTSIGEEAFAYSDIAHITIPNSVTSIGDDMITSCLSLTNITFNGTKAQCNAISLNRWYACNEEMTITCTDGEIILPATI